MKDLKITFVLPSLSLGGAERVAVELMHSFLASGAAVTCLTGRSAEHDFYSLDPRVERGFFHLSLTSAGVFAGLLNNVRVVFRLRRAFRQNRPDIVISFLGRNNIRCLFAASGLQVPLVVCERNDISQPISRLWSLLRRVSYRQADLLVVQTQRNAEAFGKIVGPKTRVCVIPNLLSENARVAMQQPLPLPPGFTTTRKLLLAMGRLEPQKGFLDLLGAVAALKSELQNWHVLILGEGSQTERLRSESANLGLTDMVSIPGRAADPFPYLQHASVFVLPSYYEGFPNALLEAMACNCAVVAYDCPSGPRELIEHNTTGLLVDCADLNGLVKAVSRVTSDSSLAAQLGQNAGEAAVRYLPEQVLPLWHTAIMAVYCSPASNAHHNG